MEICDWAIHFLTPAQLYHHCTGWGKGQNKGSTHFLSLPVYVIHPAWLWDEGRKYHMLPPSQGMLRSYVKGSYCLLQHDHISWILTEPSASNFQMEGKKWKPTDPLIVFSLFLFAYLCHFHDVCIRFKIKKHKVSASILKTPFQKNKKNEMSHFHYNAKGKRKKGNSSYSKNSNFFTPVTNFDIFFKCLWIL